MTPEIEAWATRHRISHQAMHELRLIFGLNGSQDVPMTGKHKTEAFVQSRVRLNAQHHDMLLWRNNVGALQDKTGRVVRYGLANDSEEMNRTVKSADLIGIESVIITAGMVGQRFGRFVSYECKSEDWTYTGDAHEVAQLEWASIVNSMGGRAKFTTGGL